MSTAPARSRHDVVARFFARHPVWQGVVEFFSDGRMCRPGIDHGSYVWRPKDCIKLNWDRWGSDVLVWQESDQAYCDVQRRFWMREEPLAQSNRDLSCKLRPQRLIVGALACRSPQFESRREACLGTWVPALKSRGVEVLFLVGVGDVIETPVVVGPSTHGRLGDELWLPCPDDYESLPQKTRWFCWWALAHRAFDYLFKCDDDTYIVPERLLAMDVGGSNYVGFDLTQRGWMRYGRYASGGAGYLLNRCAARLVATHVTATKGHEDVQVGLQLRRAEISLDHDARLVPIADKPELYPRPDNDLITSHACEEVWQRHERTWRDHPHLFSGPPAKKNIPKNLDVAFLAIATDRYREFLPELLRGARKHFFPGHHRTFYLFTDVDPELGDDVVWVDTPHLPWPEIVSHKSHILLKAEAALAHHDFLFLCDADMRIEGDIGEEALGDLVAVRHAGFFDKARSSFTYETNQQSTAFVSDEEGDTYYMGCVQAGRPRMFLRAHHHMAERIDTDSQNGITAVWHDESHWNRYLIDHPPDTVLPANYCWQATRFAQDVRVRLVDKDHSQVRRYEDTFVTFSALGEYGRLGNQLFQYAMLIAVAEAQGCEIAIPEGVLHGFQVTAKRLKRHELQSFKRKFHEQGEPYRYDERVLEQPAGTDFSGYFQNRCYFEKVRERVRHEFRFRDRIREVADQVARSIRQDRAAGRELVFLSARRGDYVASNGYHRPFEMDYFRRASRHFDNVLYVISSDEPSWACAHFKGDCFFLLDHPDPLVKLCVATQADHWLLSASTYGWWGAWLGQREGSKVVVPTPWYGPRFPMSPEADEMCPDDWIRQP